MHLYGSQPVHCNADMKQTVSEAALSTQWFNTFEHNLPPQSVGDILTTSLSAQAESTKNECELFSLKISVFSFKGESDTLQVLRCKLLQPKWVTEFNS